jgi:hypothetical protein
MTTSPLGTVTVLQEVTTPMKVAEDLQEVTTPMKVAEDLLSKETLYMSPITTDVVAIQATACIT